MGEDNRCDGKVQHFHFSSVHRNFPARAHALTACQSRLIGATWGRPVGHVAGEGCAWRVSNAERPWHDDDQLKVNVEIKEVVKTLSK